MNRLQSIVLAGTTLVAGSTAQQLASYDPAAVPAEELASVSCTTLSSTVDDLVSPPPAINWYAGAVAADNKNQRLYYASGNPAHGILRVAFADIGTGALPTMFASPPGMAQITGMVVDANVASGNVLIVTDGTMLGSFDVSSGAWLSPPFAAPVPAGSFLTGLAIDPFGNRLVVVDDSSRIRFRSLAGGPWSLPITPLVPVPNRPTGISFCKTAPGTPFVSYWDGSVIDPLTGASMPFPPAPGGVRHHRGLTFMGKPTVLTGSGDPQVHPVISTQGPFLAGSANWSLVVESPQLGVLFHAMAAEVTASPNAALAVPGIGGLLMVNPNNAIVIVLSGATTQVIPLSLVGVPPGIGLTFQALGVTQSQLELSDALHIMTHL